MHRHDGSYVSPYEIIRELKERISRANQLGDHDRQRVEEVRTGELFTPSSANELAGNYGAVTWPFSEQTSSSALHPVSDLPAFHSSDVNASSSSRVPVLGEERLDFRQDLKNASAHSTGSDSIVPIHVYNNNNTKPNISPIDWQGNVTATHSILSLPASNTLTTGNISNDYKVGSDFISPRVYAHHSTSSPVDGRQLNTNPQRILTHNHTADKMANANSGGRMRVKPVGDDHFMLTVEDTGINPQQLQQQMRDQAMRYPGAGISSHRQQWPTINSRQGYREQDFRQVPNESAMETVSGQPFMVTWSENGLPRINMLSTPWMAGTLGRQRGLPPSAITQQPPGEFTVVSKPPEIDIPVYKIVSNEPSPVRMSDDYEKPPTPPPRLKARRKVTKPSPVVPVSNQSSWSHTLPGRTAREHPRDDVMRENVRINAPAAIDVSRVPPAGREITQIVDTPRSHATPATTVYESVTLPPRRRRDTADRSQPRNGENTATYVTVKHIPREVDDVPMFKISSSASPTPRASQTLPKQSQDANSSKRLENSDQAPSEKSPSGYLQSYLREMRSPSPARRTSDTERGRRSSRSSSNRARSRERRMRAPSPMPEKCREIVFKDEIDWTDSQPSPSKVDWEQIVAVLSCGQDIQRLSVVTSLPHLLKDNRDECLRRVIPKIKEFLPIAQCDMQLAASSVFLQIFQSSIVTGAIFAQHFLPIILNGLDNKDGEVGEAWLDTLLEVIPMLSKEVLRREVMTKAMQKGQLPQNVQSRLMSCRILGKISICLESFVIKKDILPLVQSLCQDVEYEVRACMCRQLDLVAKGLGLESTKGAILTELVELANDEECTVRLAGLDAVVSILFLLDDETCANTIIPLVVKFCQGALQVEDSSLPVVSRHLGKLCHGLSPNMTLSQRSWFIDYFRKLCAMGRTDANDVNDNFNSKPVNVNSHEQERTVECRVNAAFNFPAMALFAGSPTKFESELSTSFSRLCKDPCVNVRKTMAHGFHEVSRCMGSHVSLLLKDLIILFKDDYCQVLNGLVSNLPDTVETLSKVMNPDRGSNSADLVAALLSCEQVIFASNDWRLQEQFVESLSWLTRLLSSEQIYQKLVPRIFDKLHNAKALPVRLAAAKTVLNYMKCNKKLEQRRSICHRIITEFSQGKSFRSRTLFIDICQQVLVIFSKAFFKEHFYESILELSSDPVPNIRLRLCLVMPSLKHTIKLPMDRNLLQQLESHVRKLLINERDRDVLGQLKVTVDELDRINCMHDSMHSRRNITDEDLADQQKEEEERLLIEMEEREKKEDENEAAAAGGAAASKKKGEKKPTSLSSPLTTKSASSKQGLDKKQPAASSSKGSKIPLPPGVKEPRRHSQHSLKTTSNSPAVNGVGSGSAGPVRLAATSAGRGIKTTSSTRSINSPNSAGSNSNVSSAGTSRGIGRSTGSIGSPLTSGIRRRADTNPENQKQDNIPTLTSIRRTSRDTVNRKQSQT